jgi:hypothetical protein
MSETTETTAKPEARQDKTAAPGATRKGDKNKTGYAGTLLPKERSACDKATD